MAKAKRKKNLVLQRLQKRRALQAKRRSRSRGPSLALDRLPLARCVLGLAPSETREELGLRAVMVLRRKTSGLLVLGCFLVDLYGAGVRDCFRRDDLTPAEFEDRLARNPLDPFEDCPEETASQLVWGSVHYARSIGFAPPRDFHSCKKLVPFLPPESIDWSLFGHDGKPLVIGDYDDLLRRSGGRFSLENPSFHYIVGGPLQSRALDSDPWDVLQEEDEGRPPGREKPTPLPGSCP